MDYFNLNNKTAFITGGCSGIGYAVAKRYIEVGAYVIVADLNDHNNFGDTDNVSFIQVDVSKEREVKEAFAKAQSLKGNLDILVNNAGVGYLPGTMVQADPQKWKSIFDVNVIGVMYGIKYGAPIINSGGTIINTASQAAITKIGGMEPYAASKSAVLSITQSAALELAGNGIRVNAVCPSNTKTPMMKESKDAAVSEQLSKTLSPSGRAAEVEDLLGIYHFLASDQSRYINGQSIVVDGGWTAGISNATINKILT